MVVDGWMEPSHSRQNAILHVYSYGMGNGKIVEERPWRSPIVRGENLLHAK